MSEQYRHIPGLSGLNDHLPSPSGFTKEQAQTLAPSYFMLTSEHETKCPNCEELAIILYHSFIPAKYNRPPSVICEHCICDDWLKKAFNCGKES